MTHKVESFGATDVGRRRRQNQDSLLFDDNLGLYIVADGMGGHNAGEVASCLAVDVVTGFIQRSREHERLTWPYGIDPTISYNANSLRTAMMLANLRIWREAENQTEYTGMGTTVVAALVGDETVTISSAGDSRAYRIRQGNGIEQITTDDTWVQAAFDHGVLEHDEVRRNPLKNIITKAVGAKQSIDLPILEETLSEGDCYLLCSDGLHGMVSDSRMLQIVQEAEGDLKRAVLALVEAANTNGGRDNITAVLLRCSSV
jgi:serine/threonine protein phosphatase PrpC